MSSLTLLNSTSLWLVSGFNFLLSVAMLRQFKDLSTQMLSSGLDVGLEKGAVAPEFEAETLLGEKVTLANYPQAVLVFISLHCSPCVGKLPMLHSLALKAKQTDIEVVLVSTDGNKAETAAFARKHKVSLSVLIAPPGNSSFVTDYKVEATPSYCFLKHGCVQAAGLFEPDTEEQLLRAWTSLVAYAGGHA